MKATGIGKSSTATIIFVILMVMLLIFSPLTSKVFNASAHIVAIKTSGNVYSFNAVEELNLKARNFTDLLDGTAFVRSDIITLQDPQNPEIMAKRDISTFKHMQTIREESAENRKAESKTRHSAASESVMKEIERRRQEEELSGTKRKTTEEIIHGNTSQIEQDVMRFQSMQPLPQDVNPGQTATTGKVSASFTSSSNSRFTSNESRLATAEEIREARWKIMRQLGKKAMIQLQTTVGNINLEIHCDMATRCGWNFVTLCKQGYYDNTVFHRLVPGFIVQGGDPTGSGAGGESAFGNGQPFRDEFDTRIFHHDKRGILSMANSGPATNGSQFFLTLAATPHLDTKHSVFGRIVGGMQTLDRMEAIGADNKTERPLQEIKINAVVVYSDPLDEADQLLEDFIRTNMQRRLSTTVQHALPGEDRSDQPAEKRLRLTTSSSSK